MQFMLNTMNLLTLPIFPLPVFLLPEGKMRLRVFEAKYLSLVSHASTFDGFIIKANSNSAVTGKKLWGSWVDIVDFNKGVDGVLEIDVCCKSLVEIQEIESGLEGLQFAKSIPFKHWANLTTANIQTPTNIAFLLERLINKNEILRSLYPEQKLASPVWVVARWMELLPIELIEKHTFIDKNGFLQAKNFVESVIFENN